MTNVLETKLYRDQHGRLRALAAKMLAASDPVEQKTFLAQLAGQLKMHLKMEDDSLYPRLLSHVDPNVRAKAQRLQESNGGLAAAFQAFYEKWIKPGAIALDGQGYMTELCGVIHALMSRMDLEDAELYTLADGALAA